MSNGYTGSKRKRDPTFTESERMALIDLVENHYSIVESKKTDAASVRAKNEEWRKIALDFNSITSRRHREWMVLKICWENMKKRAKQQITIMNQNFLGMGGGPPKKLDDDPVLQRVISIIQSVVSGFVDSYDSDGNYFLASDSGETPGVIENTQAEIADIYNSGKQLKLGDNDQQLQTTDRELHIITGSDETVDSTLINDWSQYTETTPSILRNTPGMLRNAINPALDRSPSPSQPTQTTTNSSDATRRSDRNCVLQTTKNRWRPVLRPEKESQLGLIQRKLSTLIEAKAQQHQVKLSILQVQQQKEEEQFKQEKLKTEQEQLKLDILKLQFQKLKES